MIFDRFTTMRRDRAPFLFAFLAGVLAAALAGLLAGSVGRASADRRYESLDLFSSVLHLVENNYVEPVEQGELVRGAVRGMLHDLDPHSSFMDPEAFKEMQVETKGEFHGLGIEITKRRDGFIEVVSPIEGTPAFKVGIQPHDQIVAICPSEQPEDWDKECRTTKNMTLFEAVQLMRGPRGEEITIRVWRPGFESPEPFLIVRDVVRIVSVSGRMLEPGYGYVRMRTFQESTADDLKRTLDRLREEAGDPLHGLVLDLRDNPGGLLDQAVRVADTWLDDGLIVYTQGRSEGARQEFRAHAGGTEPSYSMAILVNAGTASASEIVAGALQDHGRALVLGTQSFGKGSVQTVYPIQGGDAGLRLTTALYYTPGARSIQEVGIKPDIEVAVPIASAEPTESEGPRRLRERDLEGHFTQGEADPTGDEVEEADAGPVADPQLERAVEVLKMRKYFEDLGAGDPDATQQAQAAELAPAP